MLGSVGSIALVTGLGQSAGGPRSYLAAGMFLLATLAFLGAQADRQRAQRTLRIGGARSEYLHHLDTVRTAAREAAERQRRALVWRDPQPGALPALAAERTRVWERTTEDDDFLHVRYGVCAQPLSIDLVPPENAAAGAVDPAAAEAVRRLLAVHTLQPDLPATLDLSAVERVEVCGRGDSARGLARALVCSAAAFHSPGRLVVAVLADPDTLPWWDWVKWLPHVQSTRCSDTAGPRRMVSTSWADLVDLLPPEPAEQSSGGDGRPAAPHLLLVVDGGALPPDRGLAPRHGAQAVTVLELADRWRETEDPAVLRLTVADEAPTEEGALPVEVARHRQAPTCGLADRCDLATAEALARRLAPVPTVWTSSAAPSSGTGPAGPAHAMELFGVGEVSRYDPELSWRTRPARDRLRVPVGVGEDGGVVRLDLKEAAQQGMGPHGLVVGATGSGKSEFLRTLVLGLALTHPPEQLTLVLVDFKGGATFAGLSRLPHVSALITNLAQDLTLVDRMQDALTGELVRRQEILREAGGYTSVHDYENARLAGQPLTPLSSLLIVVDEFSELLSAKPEFIDLFVAIGRLGRSLGLHLLLASQRLDEGRLRGLESHLSYRVGLRTFSAGDSHAVLGVPDAYRLPSIPGAGYLKADQATLVRFQAAYVSGAPPPVRGQVRRDPTPATGILPFTVTEIRTPGRTVTAPDAAPPVGPTTADERASLLDVAVERMIGRGSPARQIWLPPLAVPDTLDRLLDDLIEDHDLGLTSPGARRRGRLRVPVGTVDRPREQRRDPLLVDLAGAGGHVAIVGGPRSGKSTLTRTLVAGLALTTTPRETQFFILDFGGGAFASMAALPHVAGVGTRAEPDVVRRVLAELRGVIDHREAYFRVQGIDSIETYRARRAAGRADDGFGDVFLVVDGWATLRADFDDLENDLQLIGSRGLAFGVHVIAAAARWADFRAAMRDLFGTRLELRLGDPLDSEIDRRIAALVPIGRPGRGLVQDGAQFLAALPRIDGAASADTLAEGVGDLVRRARDAWTGPAGPKLRLLPARVDLDEVRTHPHALRHPDAAHLLLGIDERALAPVALNVDTEPHLVVFGDGGSGKSSLLRTYLREVIRTRPPTAAQIVVVDYRRALLGELPEEYLLHYLPSAQQAQDALRELATYLHRRLPGPDVTPDQLRNRAWWNGAEVFVVVDDYDLVATPHSTPVAALQPLLPQARDIGLHLVVARRSGGASRALYEPAIQSLRDLGAPGVMLSGSPDEGPLVGSVRPAPSAPGRGRLITRERGVEVVQFAWTNPTP